MGTSFASGKINFTSEKKTKKKKTLSLYIYCIMSCVSRDFALLSENITSQFLEYIFIKSQLTFVNINCSFTQYLIGVYLNLNEYEFIK